MLELGGHDGPEACEQRRFGAPEFALCIALHAPEQMQPFARAGRRDISQALVLVQLPPLQFRLDPTQQGVLVRAAGVDRRQQQLRTVVRGPLQPGHQLRVVATRLGA
ncbi:MAG: hypothetical protein WBA53_12020 [Burkholderiaceae bacterium]